MYVFSFIITLLLKKTIIIFSFLCVLTKLSSNNCLTNQKITLTPASIFNYFNKVIFHK